MRKTIISFLIFISAFFASCDFFPDTQIVIVNDTPHSIIAVYADDIQIHDEEILSGVTAECSVLIPEDSYNFIIEFSDGTVFMTALTDIEGFDIY